MKLCIEAENHFPLESLAACQSINSKLVMYFTVNTAFINSLDKFPSLTESLEFPIIKNKTIFCCVMQIQINSSNDQELKDSYYLLDIFFTSLHIE